jgi:hypothetical protein
MIVRWGPPIVIRGGTRRPGGRELDRTRPHPPALSTGAEDLAKRPRALSEGDDPTLPTGAALKHFCDQPCCVARENVGAKSELITDLKSCERTRSDTDMMTRGEGLILGGIDDFEERAPQVAVSELVRKLGFSSQGHGTLLHY